MNDWPSVTTVLRPLFDATYGPLPVDPTVMGLELSCGCKRYGGGNQYTRRGQAVGDAMDVLVRGGELSTEWLRWFEGHEKWLPYLEAGRKYLRENPPSEKPITQKHLESKILRVKGHADWIWLTARKITDVKTGTTEPPRWLGLQTAGYALIAPWDKTLGRQGSWPRREILWLRDDGDYRIIPHENDAHDYMDFTTELNHYWVMRTRLNGH